MLNSAKRKPRRGVKLNKTIAVEKPSENAENSPAGEEEGGGGGIFSTMAWVVRSALKMLPGNGVTLWLAFRLFLLFHKREKLV